MYQCILQEEELCRQVSVRHVYNVSDRDGFAGASLSLEGQLEYPSKALCPVLLPAFQV